MLRLDFMPNSFACALETGAIDQSARQGLGATSRTARTAMLNAVFIAGLLFGVIA
jgi:hypothetical protein